MVEATVVGERASIPFFWRDPRAYTVVNGERIAKIDYDEIEEEDTGFWADMMEKSPSEFFVDHVVWPLLGATITALLILMITGSVWLSVKMGLDIKAMLA